MTPINRESFLKLSAALAATSATPALAQTETTPFINRFRIATLNTPDMASVAAWYQKWFDYQVLESGTVEASLADSWGAPKMAGKAYTLIASTGSPDVCIRIIQGDPTPKFNPRSTYGWGSLEFIVEDLDAQYKKMKEGGITIFREPASLGGIFESIHAMQVFGPMDMTHNLSVEKGDREKSNLPVAKSQVDRMFLIGLNGPSLEALSKFYVETFKMRKGPDFKYPSPLLAEVMGLPKDHLFSLSLVRSGQKGNTLELHDLPPPAGPRPQLDGQLPPGVGMVSFGVRNLQDLQLPYIQPLNVRPGKAYNGKRSATLTGPAGELIELIEE